jgi:3-keto-disaccharide hydrolase
MFLRSLGPALLAAALAAAPALPQQAAQQQDGPYGSIADLKLLRPEDAQDEKSTPPPDGALILFNGKDLDQWTTRDGKSPAKWKLVEGGIAQVQGGDIITRQKFDGHFHLHVEFRVPYMPKASGQGRGNSGVYLQGRYEVQVLDSYGLKSQNNDCGGIYTVAAPLVNACKAPTVWQAYDIDFYAPKCDGGKVVEPGRVTVRHNGELIHDNVRLVRKKGDQEEIVTNTTAGLGGDPCTAGPILLQDHGNPVQYRNVWLVQK